MLEFCCELCMEILLDAFNSLLALACSSSCTRRHLRSSRSSSCRASKDRLRSISICCKRNSVVSLPCSAIDLFSPSFFNSSLRFVASRLLLSLPRPLEPVAESGYDDHGAARKAGGSGLTAAVRSVGYFRPHPAAPAPAPPHPPQLHEMMCETLSCNAVSVFTVLCISVQGGAVEAMSWKFFAWARPLSAASGMMDRPMTCCVVRWNQRA